VTTAASYAKYVKRPVPVTCDLETITLYYNANMGTGVKFTEEDIKAEPMLVLDALRYLESYRGKFIYLVNMRDQLVSPHAFHPTKAQLVSILNCWMADHEMKTGTRGTSGTGPVFKHIKKLGMGPRKGIAATIPFPVKVHPAGAASTNPGCYYVTDGGDFGNNQYYGRITPNGEFVTSKDFEHLPSPHAAAILKWLEELNYAGERIFATA
jgi:hypothetical protein